MAEPQSEVHPAVPDPIDPLVTGRFVLRLFLAAIGGALGGAALTFLGAFPVSWVLWHVYHVTNVAREPWQMCIVGATNGAWMMIEGITTGLWLTAWEEIRRRRIGAGPRLAAILAFVIVSTLSHEFPSQIIITYRPRYVVAMHQTFSLLLGSIALYEPLARRPGLRALSVLIQSLAAGAGMALVLECLGNENAVTFGNWFAYSGTAFGILMGVFEGHLQAEAVWKRLHPSSESLAP